MICTTGCPTQDHPSWGSCVRAKRTSVTYCRSATNPRNDSTAERRWNKELDLYESARKQGIQPDTTKARDIMHAIKESDRVGAAYGA